MDFGAANVPASTRTGKCAAQFRTTLAPYGSFSPLENLEAMLKEILVGAVGIENNANRNFKDLEGMTGNSKTLKRNNEESRGILIGPSMAPRFSRRSDFRRPVFSQRS